MITKINLFKLNTIKNNEQHLSNIRQNNLKEQNDVFMHKNADTQSFTGIRHNYGILKKLASRDRLLRQYLEDIKHYKVLTDEERHKLFMQKQKGGKIWEEARQQLIEGNLRLVIYTVTKLAKVMNIPVKDLIQEGNIGLIKAVDTYKPKNNTKFSSYAVDLIRYTILDARSKEHTIRIPVSTLDVLKKVQKAEEDFIAQNLRNPTLSELAKHAHVSIGNVKMSKNANSMLQEPSNLDEVVLDTGKYRVRSILEKPNEPSRDKVILLRDTIYAQSSTPAIEKLEKRDKKRGINKVIATLTPQQQSIIRTRFVLDNGQEMTLEEIAPKYNLTRERIRQIEMKALRRLHHPTRAKVLREYFYGEKPTN